MWTTSNSRASSGRRIPGAEFMAMLLLGLAAACTPTARLAPDAPRAAITKPTQPVTHRVADLPSPTLKLERVVVRRLDPKDPLVVRRLGAIALEPGVAPLSIAVGLRGRTVPLGEGDSSLVIVLNGEPLHNTWVVPDAEYPFVAYLPDDTLIRRQNEVTLRWIGRENNMLMRQRLTFLATEIED